MNAAVRALAVAALAAVAVHATAGRREGDAAAVGGDAIQLDDLDGTLINGEQLEGPLPSSSTVAVLPQVECPEKEGVQTYPHPELCDQFYMCSNGTLTQERCQNGLLFKGGNGAAHHHCHYHWDVDCSARAVELVPLSSDGCEFQFGLYSDPAGACSGKYVRCEFGRAQVVDCPPGLAFDIASHRCNWADQMQHVGCSAEAVVGFHCPTGIPSNPVSARFWPYPRFAIEGDCEKLISCVNGQPRIVSCEEGLVVDDSTLTCDEPELVPDCQEASRRRKRDAAPRRPERPTIAAAAAAAALAPVSASFITPEEI